MPKLFENVFLELFSFCILRHAYHEFFSVKYNKGCWKCMKKKTFYTTISLSWLILLQTVLLLLKINLKINMNMGLIWAYLGFFFGFLSGCIPLPKKFIKYLPYCYNQNYYC